MTNHRCAGTSKRAATTGVVAAIVAALLAVAEPAAARPRSLTPSLQYAEPAAESAAPTQRDQLVPSQQRGGVSLAEATSMAQNRFQGRVVSARTVQMGDRLVHEIRILGEDGRTVRTVRIDAQSGSFL